MSRCSGMDTVFYNIFNIFTSQIFSQGLEPLFLLFLACLDLLASISACLKAIL